MENTATSCGPQHYGFDGGAYGSSVYPGFELGYGLPRLPWAPLWAPAEWNFSQNEKTSHVLCVLRILDWIGLIFTIDDCYAFFSWHVRNLELHREVRTWNVGRAWILYSGIVTEKSAVDRIAVVWWLIICASAIVSSLKVFEFFQNLQFISPRERFLAIRQV